MSLRPYKFIVKAVPQIVDEKGNVVGEEEGVQPVSLYGCDSLAKWAKEFPEQLAAAERAPEVEPEPSPPNRAQRRAKPKPRGKR